LIYLVKAFGRVTASLPKARLEIVGDGPEKEKLLLEIRKLGLESKIQLIGAQKNVRKFLSCWDLFVLPSISETFGIVILEAMEQKVPVIASAVGGIPEIIKDGKTGILVPPADSEKLAKTISWLLAEKKDRLSLSTEAYDILKKNYDWSKIIDDIENVFVGIIKA
jgi:glycosyltransferase involved in cell wall biosynthesis